MQAAQEKTVNWTRITMEYGMGCHEVVVELDDRPETVDTLHEINNFCGPDNAQQNLNRHGNVRDAVLAQLCITCMELSLTSFNVVELFKSSRAPEGWPILDGRDGIRLVSVEDFYFEVGDVTIRRDGEDD